MDISKCDACSYYCLINSMKNGQITNQYPFCEFYNLKLSELEGMNIAECTKAKQGATNG